MFSREEIRIRTNALKGLVAETNIHNWHRLLTEAQAQLEAIRANAGSARVDDLSETALRRCRRLAELALYAAAVQAREAQSLAAAKDTAMAALDALGRALSPTPAESPAFAVSRTRPRHALPEREP